MIPFIFDKNGNLININHIIFITSGVRQSGKEWMATITAWNVENKYSLLLAEIANSEKAAHNIRKALMKELSDHLKAFSFYKKGTSKNIKR